MPVIVRTVDGTEITHEDGGSWVTNGGMLDVRSAEPATIATYASGTWVFARS